MPDPPGELRRLPRPSRCRAASPSRLRSPNLFQAAALPPVRRSSSRSSDPAIRSPRRPSRRSSPRWLFQLITCKSSTRGLMSAWVSPARSSPMPWSAPQPDVVARHFWRGVLSRPIGALVLRAYAYKAGRRPAIPTAAGTAVNDCLPSASGVAQIPVPDRSQPDS